MKCATSSRYAVSLSQSLQSWISFCARQLLFAKGTEDLEENLGIVLHAAEEAGARTTCGNGDVDSGMTGIGGDFDGDTGAPMGGGR